MGSFIARSLKSAYSDIEILALDNLKRRGSELNLPLLRAEGVPFFHGDVRTPEDIEAVGSFDCIIECSAEPSVLAGVNNSPQYLINTNLMGAINCLEFARKYNAHFIFLSTSRVYPLEIVNSLNYVEGDTRFELSEKQSIKGSSSKGIAEDFPLTGARSPYGATKLCAEIMIEEYRNTYGLKTITNRCGVLAGPGQMGKVDQGFTVLWVARHYFKRELEYIGYNGSGKQVRDILHVADLFRLLQIQMENIDEYNGKTFNVGGGLERSVSLKELTEICRQATGNTIPVRKVPPERPADLRIFITDKSKIESVSGWTPQYGVEKIVEHIVQWIGENEKALRPILE